jgi:hypothetical protein
MRERIALGLIFLSWPVCIVNRFWQSAPFHPVRWIIFDKTVIQDFRWYMVYDELWLSAFFVLLAFLICRKKTRNLQIALWSVFWVSIVDIVNYWLWFRRNEMALTFEGIIMLIGAILILKHESIHHNEKAA